MKFIASADVPEMPGGQLFNAPGFHALKKDQPLVYALQHGVDPVARIIFYRRGKEVISGFAAPFGSIDYLPAISEKELNDFIFQLVQDLKTKGTEMVTIKSPPQITPDTKKVEELLQDFGFKAVVTELNQAIVINETAFQLRVVQKERNKLHRAVSEGYYVKMLNSSEISDAFTLIAETHGRKNYPVTMNEADFRRANVKLPGRYLLFGLFDRQELIAVVASVRISDQILYNFYHADKASYRRRSPLVMLIGETYKYCQENEIKILDLGISSVNGQLNQGLFRFKENLGCEVSEKKTLQLALK